MGFYESHGDSILWLITQGATLRNRFRRTSPESGASKPAEVLLRLTEEKRAAGSHSVRREGLTSRSRIWGRGHSQALPTLEPPSPARTGKGREK